MKIQLFIIGLSFLVSFSAFSMERSRSFRTKKPQVARSLSLQKIRETQQAYNQNMSQMYQLSREDVILNKLLGIEFKEYYNSTAITPEDKAFLDRLLEIVKNYPVHLIAMGLSSFNLKDKEMYYIITGKRAESNEDDFNDFMNNYDIVDSYLEHGKNIHQRALDFTNSQKAALSKNAPSVPSTASSVTSKKHKRECVIQ